MDDKDRSRHMLHEYDDLDTACGLREKQMVCPKFAPGTKIKLGALPCGVSIVYITTSASLSLSALHARHKFTDEAHLARSRLLFDGVCSSAVNDSSIPLCCRH